jgi:ribosomal protein S18 acetylase RimI-like enzyme
VTAYSANERAISFYRKAGFAPKSLTLEMGLG